MESISEVICGSKRSGRCRRKNSGIRHEKGVISAASTNADADAVIADDAAAHADDAAVSVNAGVFSADVNDNNEMERESRTAVDVCVEEDESTLTLTSPSYSSSAGSPGSGRSRSRPGGRPSRYRRKRDPNQPLRWMVSDFKKFKRGSLHVALKQGRIHGYPSRVRVGRGSAAKDCQKK